MKIKKNFTILFICFLFTIVLATAAQAQDEEVPEWAEEWANNLPVLGPLIAMGMVICCAVILIPLIIAILICIWLYKDVEKRGKSGILWVIVLIIATLFFNLIGLIAIVIIWILVRPPLKE